MQSLAMGLRWFGWLGVGVGLAMGGQAWGARPSAAELLPEKTIAVVRIADSRDLYERFEQTATGRMMKDPQLQPLVDELYGSAAEAFKSLDDKLQMTLDEIVAIPQGEISLALTGFDGGAPSLIGLVDVGQQRAAAQKLLDRIAKALVEESGATRGEETIGDVKVSTFDFGPQARVLWGERDGTVFFGTNPTAVKQLLARWDGKTDDAQPPLADNPNFSAVMKACRPARDEDVQLVWYADPITGLREAGKQFGGMQFVVAILPALGLDGLKGLGGSMAFSVGEFDSISHLHVLLDEPRSGVIEALALDAGELTPEKWVPADVSNYITLHWDFAKTVGKVKSLLDSFQGEGAFSRLLKNGLSDNLGVDVESEILPALAGRVSYLTRIEEPGSIAGQGVLVAIEVKDGKSAGDVLDKLIARVPQGRASEKKSLGGWTYYELEPLGRRLAQQAEQDGAAPPRIGKPAVGIVGHYLMLTDRVTLLEKVISTGRDTSLKTLADTLDFKVISSKVGRLAGDARPGMMSFERPEEGFRFLYNLATDPANRERLARQSGTNPLFKALNSALANHPLPPLEVLTKYLAPGGGLTVNDATGFHVTGFVLKRGDSN